MRYFSQRLQLAASVPVKPEQGVQVSQRAKPKAAPQDSPASLAHVERAAEGSCSDNAHIQGNTVPFPGCLSVIYRAKEGESERKTGIQVISEGYPGLWDGVENDREEEKHSPR